MTTEATKQASVKWFNSKSGYGFLKDLETEQDVFVHHSGINTPENVYKTLTTGEYVSYTSTTDDKGKVLAKNVTGIQGGPLLCEQPRRQGGGRNRSGGDGGDDRH
jgi:cold shock CspA family protein